MRKVTAVLLFAILGAGIPFSAVAQSTANDSARIAAQKRNARRSRKDVRQQRHAMKKAQKRMGKPVRPKTITSQTM